jgi:hypothetical protein
MDTSWPIRPTWKRNLRGIVEGLIGQAYVTQPEGVAAVVPRAAVTIVACGSKRAPSAHVLAA